MIRKYNVLQSQTADKPMVPRGAAHQSRDTGKTNQAKQPAKMIAKLEGT